MKRAMPALLLTAGLPLGACGGEEGNSVSISVPVAQSIPEALPPLTGAPGRVLARYVWAVRARFLETHTGAVYTGQHTHCTGGRPMERRNATMTIDEVEQYLDGVVDSFPPAFFENLNGGIVISRALVPSPHGQGLYILGTYHNEPYGMGRYIALNYGSFVRLHGGKPREEQERALYELLRHELTHHVESLAGVRDLEVKDEVFLETYKKKRKKKD